MKKHEFIAIIFFIVCSLGIAASAHAYDSDEAQWNYEVCRVKYDRAHIGQYEHTDFDMHIACVPEQEAFVYYNCGAGNPYPCYARLQEMAVYSRKLTNGTKQTRD